MTSISPHYFQKTLLNWFDHSGRKNLPWQHNKTPYRVWISEIMLQQTQVSTVIPYYHRFMSRFPDLASLATAEEDEVLHLWTGLGYYSRARNLLKAAQMIQNTLQGRFPDTLEDLIQLPGIGHSTAGAILSIAWQKPATILDGNVKRVLTRLYGVTTWPGEKNTLDLLWDLAQQLTPVKRIADYTQAIMDLGATLCTRSKPQCDICPFHKRCVAHQLGIAHQLPKSKPQKQRPVKQTTFLIVQYKNKVLLEKRPQTGIWAGLWSLPQIEHVFSIKDIQQSCLKMLKLKPQTIELGHPFRHTFSHFHLDIVPAFITLKSIPAKIMDSEHQIWYNLNQSQTIGLPAPVKKLLESLAL